MEKNLMKFNANMTVETRKKRRSIERKKDRRDIFFNSRNISEVETVDDLEEPVAEAAVKTPVAVKEKRYINKFLEWKKSQASFKQRQLDLKKEQKKPFTTCVKSSSSSSTSGAEFAFGSTFAPKNYQFKAPATIKKPENPAVSIFFVLIRNSLAFFRHYFHRF